MDNFVIIALLATLMALVFRLCFFIDEKINKLKQTLRECASRRSVEIINEDLESSNKRFDSEIKTLNERILKHEQTKYAIEIMNPDIEE